MGVPTFYRWLCTKYPKVIQNVVEQRQDWQESSGKFVVSDLLDENPNGVEFDNLYLDMNGLVHPCCHPEEGAQPETEAEMFQNVCDYIDRIVNIVRPRKVLFLALDGVAPRAKMNQQRSRRYKAAIDSSVGEEEYMALKAVFEAEGKIAPEKKSRWDHNVITPGTPFMETLAAVLRYFIAKRMNESTYWRGLSVILSDSNVPGEGEHKVMEFVRNQRKHPAYNPNTKHVLHGLDADLIMLALATHEPHFYILREIVTDNDKDKKGGGGGGGGREKDRKSSDGRPEAPVPQLEDCCFSGDGSDIEPDSEASCLPILLDGAIRVNSSFRAGWKPLQFLQISVLREYLANEFNFPEHELLSQDPQTGALVKVDSNLERHIDDFVILCFFVGNDFLPHLPSLSIHKGSIDQMLALYKAVFPTLGGYLSAEGFLNILPIKAFLRYIALVEPRVFEEDQRRKTMIARSIQRQKEMKARTASQDGFGDSGGQGDGDSGAPPKFEPSTFQRKLPPPGEAPDPSSKDEPGTDVSASATATAASADSIFSPQENPLMDESNADAAASGLELDAENEFKMRLKAAIETRNCVEDPKDDVNLGVGDPRSYRALYYTKKFAFAPSGGRGPMTDGNGGKGRNGGQGKGKGKGADEVDVELENFVCLVSRHFMQGMQWVLLYYYQGVQSWDWFYPYHYAPLAIDLHNYGVEIPAVPAFKKSAPLRPMEQLMANLPPRSAHFLPRPYAELMTQPTSPVADFYPINFKQDVDGKRFSWQWIALLPFIDTFRLRKAVEDLGAPEQLLTKQERVRNSPGHQLLFLPRKLEVQPAVEDGGKLKLTPKTHGLAGDALPFHTEGAMVPFKDVVEAVLVGLEGFPPLRAPTVDCYVLAPYVGGRHASEVLASAVLPPPQLDANDFSATLTGQGGGRRGPFNANVAVRMIMQVLGGHHLLKYEQLERAKMDLNRRSYGV